MKQPSFVDLVWLCVPGLLVLQVRRLLQPEVMLTVAQLQPRLCAARFRIPRPLV